MYWIPVFEILEARGFEVLLVNARDVKHVPGRKSDVNDAQWLQQLHQHGLLRGSFRPRDSVVRLRAYLRHRERLREHLQHILAAAYAAHPERFVKGRPHPADLPTAVWINPPQKKKAAQDAPGSTIVTSVDLQDPLISSPGEHLATTMIDLGATLITSPTVSRCH